MFSQDGTIQISKNKTEDLMFDVTGKLLRSKNKYFVLCQPNRGVPYVDYKATAGQEREFLLKVRGQIDFILERLDEKK